MVYKAQVAASVLALIIIAGCHGGLGPTVPEGVKNLTDRSGTETLSNRAVWGFWDCTIDPLTGAVDIIPLRQAALTVNVTKHLEGKPGNLLISDMDTTGLFADGSLNCTVTLKHPFPGVDMYNGFDVWGVFMHNGETEVGYDGLTYSGGPDAGEDEAVLQNPDGYTRWFNCPEFSGSGLPLFTFTPGKLSNLPAPTATLNPYKIFADGLGLNDDYYEWITSGDNAVDRGIFKAGGTNSRRYELKFPIIGGSPVIHFQYAVVASWAQGDPTLTGSPTAYDPYDFPVSANVDEAFLVRPEDIGSTLYYVDPSDKGGKFSYGIEVFDWQGGSVGGTGVPNEVNSIIIIGDFIPGGSHEFPQLELAGLASPMTVNSSAFLVEIDNCEPKSSGQAGFLVVVESGGLNGGSYDQDYPGSFPTGSRRASIIKGTVDISNEPLFHVIYVDDSNTSGLEDGTMANPYNTIQEGIDAAPDGYEVWVDDSGNPYVEQVNMKTEAKVKSVCWDDSDGGDRAFIDGPEDPETYSVYFNNVSGALLEGFRIGFAGPWPLDWPYYECTQMIRIDGGSNATVKDCLFTGQTNITTVYVIVISNTTDVEIANCRMDAIDRGASETACAFFRGVYAQACPGLTIRNNIFTDIRSSEDETSKGIEICFIIGSTDVVVKNNLIHHVITHSAVGYMGAALYEGFHFDSCPNVEVVNNTVDNMDSSEAFSINQCFAYYLMNCTGSTFKNNIATRIYSSGSPQPLARGISAFGCSVTCDFTDTYDIGPYSNGANYYGNASPGIGAISVDPFYLDPDNGDYELASGSPAQQGDPSFVDWDDTGSPSNDPGNTDTDTRSRIGCTGGPDGEFVGLLE
ncbi:MAG: right-handed parallel beta-helix repeat-containing protein [bacterium]